jgi:hypothetical protein
MSEESMRTGGVAADGESSELVPRPIGATAVPDAATPSSVAAGADIIQSVTKIDRAIKARTESDTVLINYWLYLFLVSWVTLGIYSIILYFKRIGRIDRFSERRRAYYDAAIEWTELYAQQQGKEADVHYVLSDMRGEIDAAYTRKLRPINALKSFLLAIITFGIYQFWVLHRLNQYWWDAQLVEQEFDDKLSQAWTKLSLTRYPISFVVNPSKRREYWLYLLLSIVTFGIWYIVWDYKIHTDPDNLFNGFHTTEDTVLQVIRSH